MVSIEQTEKECSRLSTLILT